MAPFDKATLLSENYKVNQLSEHSEEMKRLCQEYLDEGNEESPDYGSVSMEIAQVATNYLLEKGEIKVRETN